MSSSSNNRMMMRRRRRRGRLSRRRSPASSSPRLARGAGGGAEEGGGNDWVHPGEALGAGDCPEREYDLKFPLAAVKTSLMKSPRVKRAVLDKICEYIGWCHRIALENKGPEVAFDGTTFKRNSVSWKLRGDRRSNRTRPAQERPKRAPRGAQEGSNRASKFSNIFTLGALLELIGAI